MATAATSRIEHLTASTNLTHPVIEQGDGNFLSSTKPKPIRSYLRPIESDDNEINVLPTQITRSIKHLVAPNRVQPHPIKSQLRSFPDD
jgi:hypothetical protein